LVDTARLEGKKSIFLISSTFRRTTQTSELIKEQIKKIDPTIKVRISTDKDLGNIYDGEINLPPNYKSGDQLRGFTVGKKIFNNEVFTKTPPNFLYKFGDPVWNGSSFEFPELKDAFKSFGESYRDFFVRTLNFILNVRKNLERLDIDSKFVLVSHGLQFEMFYDLEALAKDVLNGQKTVTPGELAILCWEKYNERISSGRQNPKVRYIDLNILNEPTIQKIIEDEMNYLKGLK
jgi:broad specificity phosphatase PhoE